MFNFWIAALFWIICNGFPLLYCPNSQISLTKLSMTYNMQHLRTKCTHIKFSLKGKESKCCKIFVLNHIQRKEMRPLLPKHVDFVLCVKFVENKIHFGNCIKNFNAITMTHLHLKMACSISWEFLISINENDARY